jgi:hypothetical protein
MTIPGISPDLRGWVLVIFFVFSVVVVLYPLLTTRIDLVSSTYETANPNPFRSFIAGFSTKMSDAKLYRLALGLPHFVLLVANWFYN